MLSRPGKPNRIISAILLVPGGGSSGNSEDLAFGGTAMTGVEDEGANTTGVAAERRKMGQWRPGAAEMVTFCRLFRRSKATDRAMPAAQAHIAGFVTLPKICMTQ